MAKELLKDVSVRNAKATDKDYRLNDGEGLYIIIKTNDAKWWRFDYTFKGQRKTLSVGVYPATGLADARRKAEEGRVNIANGIDPSDTRKAIKVDQRLAAENVSRLDAGLPAINSFEHITRDWLTSINHTVREITHQKKIRRFELHVFPAIGGIAIVDVKAPDIFSLLKPIIAKNELETAHRVHSEVGAAFNYAIAHGLFSGDNPALAVAAQIPAQKPKHRGRTNRTSRRSATATRHLQLSRHLCSAMRVEIVTATFSTPW